MRTIVFATGPASANSRESYLFLLGLLAFAVVAAGRVLHEGLADGRRSRYKLLLHVTMILTSVIPPELPMELSIAASARRREWGRGASAARCARDASALPSRCLRTLPATACELHSVACQCHAYEPPMPHSHKPATVAWRMPAYAPTRDLECHTHNDRRRQLVRLPRIGTDVLRRYRLRPCLQLLGSCSGGFG